MKIIHIFLCLCSLPSTLCCAFTYFPHLSTTPFTKPFNAKWHCLQCYFLKLPPSVNVSLFKREFVWQLTTIYIIKERLETYSGMESYLPNSDRHAASWIFSDGPTKPTGVVKLRYNALELFFDNVAI